MKQDPKPDNTKTDSRIIIFDTTLRDGEQSPGISLSPEDKLAIAIQLEALGVDVIEAGFARASSGDYQAIERIAKTLKQSTVCALARAIPEDIRQAGEALRHARRARMHTFIATSDIHMRHKLNMSPERVIEQAIKAVRYAKEFCEDVEFSAEDASRSDCNFLIEVCEAVIDAGATTINLPDTVGYCMPQEIGDMFRHVIASVRRSDKVVWSAHCHDDLGCAVANTLQAIQSGARQVECTVNGIGERAGNAALEEIVMALRTRYSMFRATTNIHTTEIAKTSRMVAEKTGYTVQRNKAIVGANAFSHASGIHQDGMLKSRGTYEIINPEDVGLAGFQMPLGKLSGRSAMVKRIENLGITVKSAEEVSQLFSRFKELADSQAKVSDQDLMDLVASLA